MITYKFFLLLACHFLGDFPFQGDYIGHVKGQSWEAMMYHCLVYTATFIIFAKISLLFALILFSSHFLIDPLKARYGIIKRVWVDQLLHIIIIYIGFHFKW